MRRKQLFALAMAGVISVSMAPVGVFAEEGTVLEVEASEEIPYEEPAIEEPQSEPVVQEEIPAEPEPVPEVIPEETIPEETIPEETVPEETIPEETVPEEPVEEKTPEEPAEEEKEAAEEKQEEEQKEEEKEAAEEEETTADMVTTEADLLAKIGSAEAGDSYTTIIIANDIELTATVEIPAQKKICIVTSASEAEISRADGFKDDMFLVNGILTFQEAELLSAEANTGKIRINGALPDGSKASGSIINVASADAVFAMDDSLTLTGNKNEGKGGAVYTKGMIILMGGSITGNQASEGAGIYAENLVSMGKSANVTGNTVLDTETADNIALDGDLAMVAVDNALTSGKAGVHAVEPYEGRPVIAITANASATTSIADVLPAITLDNADTDGYFIDEKGCLALPHVSPELSRVSGPVWTSHTSAEITCVSNVDGWYYAGSAETDQAVPVFDVANPGIPVQAEVPFTVSFTDITTENPVTIYVLIKDKNGTLSAKKAAPLPQEERPALPTPTATNTPTPEPTATNTPTPEPTATNTPTPEPTATNTPTPEPTATNTPTPEPTATNTPTPLPTATNTPTPKPTATSTPAPTIKIKPIVTPDLEEIGSIADVEGAEEFVDDDSSVLNFVGASQAEGTINDLDKELYDFAKESVVKFSVTGKGMDIESPKEGDIRWKPVYWLSWQRPERLHYNWEITLNDVETDSEGHETANDIVVCLRKETFKDGEWSNTNEQGFLQKTVVCKYEGANPTVTPGPDEPSVYADVEGNLENVDLSEGKTVKFFLAGYGEDVKSPEEGFEKYKPSSAIPGVFIQDSEGTLTAADDDIKISRKENEEKGYGHDYTVSSLKGIDDEKTIFIVFVMEKYVYTDGEWKIQSHDDSRIFNAEITTKASTATVTPTPTNPTDTPTPEPTTDPFADDTPTPTPEHTPVIANINDSVVHGLENRLLLTPGTFYKFSVTGAGTNNTSPGEGDTRWVPVYWRMKTGTTKQKNWQIGAAKGISDERDIPILIFLQEQKYTNGTWTATGAEGSIEATVKTQAYNPSTITITPGGDGGYSGGGSYNGGGYYGSGTDDYSGSGDDAVSNPNSDGATTGSTTAKGASTGDETPLTSMMMLVMLSMLTGGYVIVRKRKRI